MKTLGRIALISTVFLALAAAVRAEPRLAEDDEWQTLSQLPSRKAERASARPATIEAAKVQAEQTRHTEITRLVDRADQFKDFQRKHPKNGKAREAKRQETILLLQAGFHGDQAQLARRKQLAGEIRADRNFTPAERLEVAGYADNLEVVAQQIAVPDDLTAALEKVARQLVAECPGVPAGYESLLNLAKNSSPERAKVLFGDLLEMPAPDAVKLQAAHWLDRYALVGRPLADLVKSAMGADKRLERTKEQIVVIYAWSVDDNPSIELAKQVGSIRMPGLTFFGVNLDESANLGRAQDIATLLPGEQLILGKGATGALATALLLDETPLLYVTDRKGVLLTVSAHNRPSRAIIDASIR
jgi:hypothetical protein